MICTRCLLDKEEAAFSFRGIGIRKRRKQCKACRTVNTRAYVVKNKSKIDAWYKDWREKNREKIRAGARRRYQTAKPEALARCRRYELLKNGWSPETKALAIKEQKGTCAIVGCREPAKYADHDHKTGKARAVLCRNCNVALGLGRDNSELIRGWLQYLERWK